MHQVQTRIPLDLDTLVNFCKRWGIEELAIFGSVLREDFNLSSDIDLLVTFVEDRGGVC